ncbi:MAG: oligopeptide transport system ATP-binding protein [Reinekea sp.]|jgi:oligopeptide transport system ATP-binding protein
MTQAREKLLAVEDLKVYFDIYPANAMPWTKPHKLKAVDGVSFEIYAGETLGIVGESGCGKSTLARAVIKMVPAEAGQVLWLGQDLLTLSKKKMQAARKDLQMIFQDPLASLNPRMTIGDIIAEPLKTHYPAMPTPERKLKVKEMMVKVGLLPNQINRYPHEFSGGQCQRIGIARALILKPKLIICDEPVSALDVSIQAQIVNLLMDLQAEMGLSLIFIAHDLSIVQHISTRVMVLYLGNVCEITSSEQLYARPRHPYTQALISAVPIPDPEIERNKKLILIEGDLPSPINPPSGCVFRTRCYKVQPKCSEQRPNLEDLGGDHRVACFYPEG